MRAIAIVLGCLAAAPAGADAIPFDAAWKTQRLTLFGPQNAFAFEGARLRLTSEDAVSLAYRELDPALWQAGAASWDWQVSEGVGPTDLARKGGDDRNLALYFLFLPEARARELRGAPVTQLLDEESARILVYVWGGAHGAGSLLDSPYLGDRGKTLVLRGAGTGAAAERVDLAADHARAFGEAPGALVGIAVSADSDDTDGRIAASVSDLRLD